MAELPENPEQREEPPKRFDPVLLEDQYLIDPNAPLADLDTPSAKAYESQDRADPNDRLFALVCDQGLPCRGSVMSNLEGNPVLGQLPLLQWATAFWPPAGKTCLILIYGRPMGGRLATALQEEGFRIHEHDIPDLIIRPAVAALTGFATRRFAHRSLRTSNIFFEDGTRGKIVLGDCVSVPAGFDQPAIYEPLPRALASPAGRGNGEISDDLFALGVTLVHVALGYDPMAEVELNEQLYRRMEKGTYSTLCGDAQIPLSLIEPLRGLLRDDEDARWGTAELEQWMSGHRQSMRSSKTMMKAQSPLRFSGKDYVTLPALAHALSQNPADGATLIRTGELETWVQGEVPDKSLFEAVQKMTEASKAGATTPQGSDDFLVAKAATILDPGGPVRYKGVSFMPEGFGPTMAAEFLQRGNMQISAEILSQNVVGLWFAAQPKKDPQMAALEKEFADLRRHVQLNVPGEGIERCLYETNPVIPCESPHIQEDYVFQIEGLLPALDKASNKAEPKSKPIDRHVAAFIADRFKQNIEPHMKALASDQEETSLIGMLSLLALLQYRTAAEQPLYGLSSWMGGQLGPAIATYYNRNTRREIEKAIPRFVRQGSLLELFDLIDNTEKRSLDKNGFGEAKAEFATAEEEIEEIEENLKERAESADQTGQQSAAMVSIILAMFVVTVLFLTGSL